MNITQSQKEKSAISLHKEELQCILGSSTMLSGSVTLLLYLFGDLVWFQEMCMSKNKTKQKNQWSRRELLLWLLCIASGWLR